MSWMISAQRDGSSVKPCLGPALVLELARSAGGGAECGELAAAPARPHERLEMRPDLGAHRVERMRRGHE